MATSSEVIRALIAKRPAPRIGFYDLPWADTVRGWAAEGKFPVGADGQPIDALDHFHFDMTNVGGFKGGFDSMLPIRGFREVVEETDEWVSVRNGGGAVRKNWKNKSGTPEHVSFSMTSREIWERDYRPHLLHFDRERLALDLIRQRRTERHEQGYYTAYGSLFVFELMRICLGDVCMCESMLLDPDWIHDFNRVYTDFMKMHYRAMFEESGVPDGIWVYEDLGYKDRLFISPKMLSELIMPYYAELVEFLHGYGVQVILHSCGCVTEALPLIVEAGFDALNPMEVKAGCDVVEFAKRYGNKLAFIGGMDARILESGDREAIRKEVTRLCESMKGLGASYVWGSDHSLSTRVAYDDFRYAIDVYREHCEY